MNKQDDWVYIGAKVIRPDGFVDEIYSISEDRGIRLEDGGNKYYCRTELKPFIEKPTKTEMIDKAIKDLGGDISKAGFHGWEGHTYLKATNGYAGRYALCHYNSSSVTDGLTFCTIEEFEQRKKELEQMNKGWYDYENQKMLKSPPVGEVVLVNMESGERKAKVLEITNNHHSEIFVVRVFNSSIEGIGDLRYKDKAKPLDWDKLSAKKKLIEEVSALIYQNACCSFDVEEAVEKLYELGYLKLQENNA